MAAGRFPTLVPGPGGCHQPCPGARPISTIFLERDLPALGIDFAAHTMRRFWMMLAHWNGNVFNASEFARSLDVSSPTIKRYLDILAGTFMIRPLQPWHVNIRKRQVKSPKIYFRDMGIMHALLNLPDQASLEGHPKLGASWEGFALEQVVQILPGRCRGVLFSGALTPMRNLIC